MTIEKLCEHLDKVLAEPLPGSSPETVSQDVIDDEMQQFMKAQATAMKTQT